MPLHWLNALSDRRRRLRHSQARACLCATPAMNGRQVDLPCANAGHISAMVSSTSGCLTAINTTMLFGTDNGVLANIVASTLPSLLYRLNQSISRTSGSACAYSADRLAPHW
jgi:uncharacterized protein YaaQ